VNARFDLALECLPVDLKLEPRAELRAVGAGAEKPLRQSNGRLDRKSGHPVQPMDERDVSDTGR